MRTALPLPLLVTLTLLAAAGCSPSAGGACATQRDCNTGESCISGACTASREKGCTSDQNCQVGQTCDLATNACITIQVTSCTGDGECPATQRCNTLTGICVDGRRSCTTSAECTGGLMCDVAVQQCVECLDVSHCGTGEACTGGACVPNTMGGCSTDPQCSPPSQICMAGACTLGCAQPGGLTCSNGEVCDNNTGRCVSIRGPCMGDPECNVPLQVCEFGQCIPGCTEFGGVQCQGGQQCNPSTGRCIQVGDICLSDLECNQPQEICNLTSGACDPGCGLAGCTGGDTCDSSTGHCTGSRTCLPDRLEPNDTAAQASPGGGTQVGLTLCPGDVDFYGVALSTGDDITITVDFVHGEGNVDVELLNGTTVVAMSNGTGNTESIQFSATAAGTYTVRVYLQRDLGPGPGNQYSIDIDSTVAPCNDDSYEDNDSPLLAPFLSPGTTSLSVCPSDDDYFDVFVDAGEQITVNARFTNAQGDMDLALLGFFGIPLETSVTSNDIETVTHTQQNAGFVTIQVTLWQDAGTPGNAYDLEVTIGASQPQTCPVDGFEENDSRTAAAALSLGTQSSLNACQMDDDFYALSLLANDQLTVSASFTNSEGDIDLELMSSAGTVVASAGTTGNTETITYTVPSSGTYYVRVFLYGDAGSTVGNSYNLTTSVAGTPPPTCVVDTFEPNNSMSGAPAVTMGSYTNLGSCGDDDYFGVALTAGQSITIQVQFTHTEGDIDIVLFDTAGVEAARSETTSNTESISGTVNVSGTFTLRVFLYADAGSNTGNTYNLSLSP